MINQAEFESVYDISLDGWIAFIFCYWYDYHLAINEHMNFYMYSLVIKCEICIRLLLLIVFSDMPESSPPRNIVFYIFFKTYNLHGNFVVYFSIRISFLYSFRFHNIFNDCIAVRKLLLKL